MSLKVFCFSALLFLGFTLNICSAQLLNFTTDMARIRDLNYKLNGKSIEFPDDYLCEIHKEEGNYVPKNIIATRMQIYGYEAIIAQPRY